MRLRLRRLLRQFEKRERRERQLILLTTVAGIIALLYLAVASPLDRAATAARKAQRATEDELGRLEQQLSRTRLELSSGPSVRLRDERTALVAQLASTESDLGRAAASLITPRMMADMLERMLAGSDGLRLVEVQNHEAEPLTVPANASLPGAGEAQPVASGLYRHGFVLRFEGDFFGTLAYLRALEKLPWPFFWDSLNYEVREYPRAGVSLEVHTLSTDREWIGV